MYLCTGGLIKHAIYVFNKGEFIKHAIYLFMYRRIHKACNIFTNVQYD